MKPRTRLFSMVAALLCLTFLVDAGRGSSGTRQKPGLDPSARPQAKPTGPRARFLPLGFGDNHFWWTTAFSVSDDGRVVVGIGGRAEDGYLEAWRWTPSTGTEGLGDLPGWDGWSDAAFESSANGVSGDGRVVVGEGQAYTGDQAWRWTSHDGMVAMGTLPGPYPASRATAANGDGSVFVGSSSSTAGWQAFRWTEDDGMQPLGTLGGNIFESLAADVSDDGDVVVGVSYGATGWEAYRWTPEDGMVGLGQVNGSTWTEARAVSADGQTVVGYAIIGGHYQAFRWTPDEGMVGLGYLAGGIPISMADGVSGDGSVVVGAGETSNPYGMNDAFIWDAEHGMRLLQRVLTEEYGLDLTGWRLTRAFAISPDGTCIVGQGTNPAGEYESWQVVLPRRPKKAAPQLPSPRPRPAKDLTGHPTP